AVVPGAAGSRSFGNGGGMGRDDAAGFLEIAELERDRSADDFILPIVGNGETPGPIHPIVDGAVAEFAAGGFELGLKALIDAEYEMMRPREHEGSFALDVGQRRVGGEADDRRLVDEANMIAADGTMGERLSVIVRRAETKGDTRQPGHRFDHADELR